MGFSRKSHSKLNRIGYRAQPRQGAGVVGFAARRTRDANAAEQAAGGLYH
jgi:hypothetical protein